jgi:hypothetical protein
MREVFTIGEEPVEVTPGIWLSYVDGMLQVRKEEPYESTAEKEN